MEAKLDSFESLQEGYLYFWRLISVKRIYFYGDWEIISVRYSNIHRKATYRKQKDVEKISYFPKEILQYINLYFFSEGLLFFFDISKIKCTFSTHLTNLSVNAKSSKIWTLSCFNFFILHLGALSYWQWRE